LRKTASASQGCASKRTYYLVCIHSPDRGGDLATKAAIYESDTLGGLRDARSLVVGDLGSFLESPEMWLLDGRWYIYCTVVRDHGARNVVHVLESASTDPLGS
jgi:GH43 family beta-xylosidase